MLENGQSLKRGGREKDVDGERAKKNDDDNTRGKKWKKRRRKKMDRVISERSRERENAVVI